MARLPGVHVGLIFAGVQYLGLGIIFGLDLACDVLFQDLENLDENNI